MLDLDLDWVSNFPCLVRIKVTVSFRTNAAAACGKRRKRKRSIITELPSEDSGDILPRWPHICVYSQIIEYLIQQLPEYLLEQLNQIYASTIAWIFTHWQPWGARWVCWWGWRSSRGSVHHCGGQDAQVKKLFMCNFVSHVHKSSQHVLRIDIARIAKLPFMALLAPLGALAGLDF